MLSGVTTVVQQGGIGRRGPSRDGVAGLLWYSDTLPAGFSSSTREKRVLTLEDAEALGILDTVSAVQVLHYHVSEFFRLNPEGELWIGIYDVPDTYDFTELEALYNAAQGDIRITGIYANLLTFVASQITAIQAVITTQEALGYHSSVLYAPNFASGTDRSAVADARALTAPKVTTVIGQDGGGAGAALFTAKGFSISCLGAELGALSRAQVQQSIGNPANFDISDGTELETLALSSGKLLSTVSNSLLSDLKGKGYSVVRKYTPKLAGSYLERVPTSVSATNDYAWIEFNRTIDKARRNIESILTPQLQSGVPTKSDGTLRDDVIGYFQNLVGGVLLDMMAAGEISGDAGDIKKMVLIDPTQNIQATSTLEITVKIIPVGVAEFITVKIGFTTSL